MASQGPQRPRRNASPASSSKPQPMRATLPFSLLRNPSPTRTNTIRKPSPSSSPVHGVENGFKARRSSPETRASPEHRRSPTSPSSLGPKGKVLFVVESIIIRIAGQILVKNIFTGLERVMIYLSLYMEAVSGLSSFKFKSFSICLVELKSFINFVLHFVRRMCCYNQPVLI